MAKRRTSLIAFGTFKQSRYHTEWCRNYHRSAQDIFILSLCDCQRHKIHCMSRTDWMLSTQFVVRMTYTIDKNNRIDVFTSLRFFFLLDKPTELLYLKVIIAMHVDVEGNLQPKSNLLNNNQFSMLSQS